MEKEKTYYMVYICLNCKQKLFKQILWGQSACGIGEWYHTDDQCSYCGGKYFSVPFHPNDKRVIGH